MLGVEGSCPGSGRGWCRKMKTLGLCVTLGTGWGEADFQTLSSAAAATRKG